MLALGENERWYVVQYLSRHERMAVLNLEAQNFRVFFPQMLRSVRHARQLRVKRTAVFPGYLFTALDLDRDRWRSINGTLGVARLLMTQTRPVPVPVGLVEELISNLDENGDMDMRRSLTVGQSVRVKEGPFTSLIGEIATLDEKGRARILLKIMSGAVVTTLESKLLEPVSA